MPAHACGTCTSRISTEGSHHACAMARCRTTTRSGAACTACSGRETRGSATSSGICGPRATPVGMCSSRTSCWTANRRDLRRGSRGASSTRGVMGSPEVITMGRVGVDLYPEQIGVPLAEVRTFAKSLGGSATNVAVAAARLGRRAAVITKVGRDGFGDYVRKALAGFGVDPRWVSTDPVLRTPIVFCEVHPPDNFPLLFYREPKAPDMNLSREDLDLEAIAAAPLELGPQLVVVKRGPDGAYARTAREEVSVPAIRITVLNGLGAGDAFGGALCHGLLAGWGLARALAVANAAGAIVASRLACADAMPTFAEIEAVLSERVVT